MTGEDPGRVCIAPRVERTIEPDPALRERFAARIEAYRSLYAALRERFAGDA